MADDPVAQYLRTLNISDTIRAQAWNAAYADDDADAEAQMRKLPKYLAPKVLEDLWNLRAGGTLVGEAKPFAPARAEDYVPGGPTAPSGSVGGRVLAGAGEMLNPVEIAKGVWNMLPVPEALGGAGVLAPVYTAGHLLKRQFVEQPVKAYEAAMAGRPWEALGHTIATVTPVVGPVAADIGEGIAETGDIATGLGRGVGLLAPFGVPAVARGAVRATRAAPVTADAAAAALEQAAATRVTQVIAPKSAANVAKRLGTTAEKIAPELVEDLAAKGAPFSREGYHAQIRTSLAEAEAGLDAAADARLAARSHATQPLIEALLEKRRALTAEAPEATGIGYQHITVEGKPATTWITNRGPLGADVVPGPYASRVAVIDQAIAELKQLGPVTSYDPIRLVRQAYDSQGKVIYHPSMTADFLTHQGRALGAADVAGALREALGRWDPGTAAANAPYALYRSANDVLNAAAEIERVRPKVGRQIMARLTGVLLGSQAGPAGAVAGYVGAPLVDTALASGATTQLKTAALMKRLAEAIRRGDVKTTSGLTQTLWRTVKQATPAAVQSGRGRIVIEGLETTSPSGSRSQPTESAR